MNQPDTRQQWKQWVSDREVNGRSMTPAMIRDEKQAARIKAAREAEAEFSLPFNLKKMTPAMASNGEPYEEHHTPSGTQQRRTRLF